MLYQLQECVEFVKKQEIATAIQQKIKEFTESKSNLSTEMVSQAEVLIKQY